MEILMNNSESFKNKNPVSSSSSLSSSSSSSASSTSSNSPQHLNEDLLLNKNVNIIPGSGNSGSRNGSGTTDANDEEIYCICKRTSDESEEDMMIECDVCKDWLHGRCVNLNHRLAADIETYVCPRCISDKKQIIYKKRKNFHRHDYSDGNAAHKPMQAGTPAFIEKLLKRQFQDAIENNLVLKLNHGSELTFEYLEKHGFKKPILIEKKVGLGFSMPDANQIDLTEIQNIVGSNYMLDVIDVERQEVFQMSIQELNDYFQAKPRTKTYNLISFEISKTKLTENIQVPSVVHDISWVSNGVWPKAEFESVKQDQTPNSSSKEDIVKPEVQKYCLISAANSYTDFHVDFGGSSVWYHTVKGDKIFYLIEPTEENMAIYEKWNNMKNHSEIFLGDEVKNCYRFNIKEGNTIFLPTGWIHAVYTPNDSLVFGGNFLQSYNIPLQIKCYEMELRLKTPEKYRFPAFETLQWYAAKYYTQKLKEINHDRKCISNELYHGLKYLRDTLKRWINSKDYYQTHDYEIPRKINCDKLVIIMSKELTKQENLLKSNGLFKSENPPKLKIKIEKAENKVFIENNSDFVNVDDKKTKSTKKKEVLNYENLVGIKLDDNDTIIKEEIKQEEKPHIIMKLTKTSSDNLTSVITNTEPKSVIAEPNEIKADNGPIKLKLKLPPQVPSQTAQITSINPRTSLDKSNELDELIKKNDSESDNEDEVLNELKNSYADDDYVYPSINGKSKSRSSVTNSGDDSEKKSARKRKLKPFAAQYLQPKQTKTEENHSKEAKIETDANIDQADAKKVSKEEAKPVKPKKMIDKLIEKNLKPQINKKTASKEELIGKEKTNKDEEDDKDKTYKSEDDEDEDDDEDFKLKCKNNLKLSKKIKSNLKKQQKLNEQPNLTPSASGISTPASKKDKKKDSSATFSVNPTQQNKKPKKGLTTTKQRLSKLLKLNRPIS